MRTKNAFYNIISSLVLELVYVLFGFIIPIIYIKNYGSNAKLRWYYYQVLGLI